MSASLHLVVRTVNAAKSTGKLYAHVYQGTSVRLPLVDQSVWRAQNARKIWLVPTRNVETRAQVLVVLVLSAKLSTTIRYAPVLQDTLGIHSLGASFNHVCITSIRIQMEFLDVICYPGNIVAAVIESAPVDPCNPSPCGHNALCRPVGDSPSCSCLPSFIGSPPNCRPECVSNTECPSNLACINQKCRDPCPGSCGADAQCRVVSHAPNCQCIPGYTGDPFTQCYVQPGKVLYELLSKFFLMPSSLHSSLYVLVHTIQEHLSPCDPSPCGANAVCREQNGAGSCTCVQDYFGNPYEGCRPECVVNSDCSQSRACVRNKCQDPCPGTCGQNAECRVVSHLPQCSCLPGYSGDPFRHCAYIPPQRKRKVSNKIFPFPLKKFQHLIYTFLF